MLWRFVGLWTYLAGLSFSQDTAPMTYRTAFIDELNQIQLVESRPFEMVCILPSAKASDVLSFVFANTIQKFTYNQNKSYSGDLASRAYADLQGNEVSVVVKNFDISIDQDVWTAQIVLKSHEVVFGRCDLLNVNVIYVTQLPKPGDLTLTVSCKDNGIVAEAPRVVTGKINAVPNNVSFMDPDGLRTPCYVNNATKISRVCKVLSTTLVAYTAIAYLYDVASLPADANIACDTWRITFSAQTAFTNVNLQYIFVKNLSYTLACEFQQFTLDDTNRVEVRSPSALLFLYNSKSRTSSGSLQQRSDFINITKVGIYFAIHQFIPTTDLDTFTCTALFVTGQSEQATLHLTSVINLPLPQPKDLPLLFSCAGRKLNVISHGVQALTPTVTVLDANNVKVPCENGDPYGTCTVTLVTGMTYSAYASMLGVDSQRVTIPVRCELAVNVSTSRLDGGSLMFVEGLPFNISCGLFVGNYLDSVVYTVFSTDAGGDMLTVVGQTTKGPMASRVTVAYNYSNVVVNAQKFVGKTDFSSWQCSTKMKDGTQLSGAVDISTQLYTNPPPPYKHEFTTTASCTYNGKVILYVGRINSVGLVPDYVGVFDQNYQPVSCVGGLVASSSGFKCVLPVSVINGYSCIMRLYGVEVTQQYIAKTCSVDNIITLSNQQNALVVLATATNTSAQNSTSVSFQAHWTRIVLPTVLLTAMNFPYD